MSALGQKQTFAPQKVMSGTTRGIRGGHLAIMARASSDPAATCGNATGELLEANGRHSAKPNPVTPAAEVLGQSGSLVIAAPPFLPQGPSRLWPLPHENLNHEGEERKAVAMDLVSLIMKFLTPDMIGRLASALGLDRSTTSSAIEAAVPGLLAALAGVAAKPDGAQKLADAAKKETATLDKFASMLGTSGQASIVERGSQMLTSLLGKGDQNALANAVGTYSGLGSTAGGSLLSALAPVVMGTIARQQGVLNAGNIANLFASQKDNIAGALPSSFGRMLSGTGLLDTLGDAARRTIGAGSEATRAAAASVARTIDDTRRSAVAAPASTNWLLWAIPALAIAALLLWLLAKPTEQAVQQGVTTAQNLTVGGIDLGKQVTDSINTLRSTLTDITDPASAQAALPRLREATAQIDKVSGMVGQLSEAQRKVLAGLVNPMMSTLNQLFDKVLAIPGVAEVIKPTVDTLKAKLATLVA